MKFGDQNCVLCSFTPGKVKPNILLQQKKKTLNHKKIEQQVIDITCLAGESVEFYSEGPKYVNIQLFDPLTHVFIALFSSWETIYLRTRMARKNKKE